MDWNSEYDQLTALDPMDKKIWQHLQMTEKDQNPARVIAASHHTPEREGDGFQELFELLSNDQCPVHPEECQVR